MKEAGSGRKKKESKEGRGGGGQAVKQQKQWSKFFDPGCSCDYSAYGSDHPLRKEKESEQRGKRGGEMEEEA